MDRVNRYADGVMADQTQKNHAKCWSGRVVIAYTSAVHMYGVEVGCLTYM